MVYIKRVERKEQFGENFATGVEIISPEVCRELSDLQHIVQDNLIEDGNGTVIIGGLTKGKKKFRKLDFLPLYIIQASSKDDQVFIQTNVDDTEDMLFLFWSLSQLRGGLLIKNGLSPYFADDTRASISYHLKTRRIHHIEDDQKLTFFILNKRLDAGQEEDIEKKEKVS